MRLEFLLRAPSCGIWSLSNTGGQGGQYKLPCSAGSTSHPAGWGRRSSSGWVSLNRPVCLPCNLAKEHRSLSRLGSSRAACRQGLLAWPSPVSSDGGSPGASIQPCPSRSAQALACPLLRRGDVCAAACREAATLSGSGMGTPFASSSPVCYREPVWTARSSFLSLGSPSAPEAAGSQVQCVVPLPGHFTGSCGCSFAWGCRAEPLCLPCKEKCG